MFNLDEKERLTAYIECCKWLMRWHTSHAARNVYLVLLESMIERDPVYRQMTDRGGIA